MVVVDIPCPVCARTDAVEKRGLNAYYCRACERAFDADAIR
ncbi:ribosomal protein L37AE/L43A [Halarchaeum rubridurum]|uniref:Ribosomal protein L37AE/L43A n=1 Tax=Halarchaeum rubridurum TaxID=489911 RepID=A0A8T4GQA5_9EURY|nr:hypothetical protein [Halarchaeum rubridurum]MBP1955485.1 ribosomal protein L37AE/L43A [Halarchaeum rubridurum]